MVAQVFIFGVTTSAGVALATPTTTNTTIPVRIVRRISVRVPPGPAGHFGFQICVNGVSVVPVNQAEWIVTDDEKLEFEIDIAPESGAWQVKSYNTGIHPHKIEVRYYVDLPSPRVSVSAGIPLEI